MASQTIDHKTATGTTTDATQTAIATVPVPANSTIAIEASVMGLKSDKSVGKAFELFMSVRDSAGVSAVLGALVSIIAAQGDVGAAAWTADLSLSGTTVSVRVTGAAATTVNWIVMLRTRTYVP